MVKRWQRLLPASISRSPRDSPALLHPPHPFPCFCYFSTTVIHLLPSLLLLLLLLLPFLALPDVSSHLVGASPGLLIVLSFHECGFDFLFFPSYISPVASKTVCQRSTCVLPKKKTFKEHVHDFIVAFTGATKM